MQLATFTNGLETVSEWTGRIFMWLIIPLTLVVVYEVISMKIFQCRPTSGRRRLSAYLYGPYFMLVAAYTLALQSPCEHRHHLLRNFPPEPGAFWIVLPT